MEEDNEKYGKLRRIRGKDEEEEEERIRTKRK